MPARAASSTPVIAIRNLTVWGTPKPILKDVNWTVNPGEHWVILGANGSGKTSVLGALTGYLTPGAGDIAVMGHTYGEYDWRELRKSIGIVSANVRNIIHDDNSALEIVATGKDALLHYWGDVRPAEKRAARALLKQVECERLEDRPWWVLSQGERQRVLIARALMAKPKLLILDEPCAGLDPVARENFLAFVERLAGDAKAPTLVLVTHHVEEILPAFTHTLLLRDGGVIAAGTKQEILRAPLLSKTFGAPVRLTSRAGRYSLAVKANRNVAV